MFFFDQGGASVHLHMMSPKSEGLFSRAFSQSGTAFNPFAVHPPWRARSQAETIAEWFGCPTANSEAMIRCLKTVELTSLVSSQIHLIVSVCTLSSFYGYQHV